MLVLSRKIDEVLIIKDGDTEIRVMVVDIRGDKVRLGVDAPPHVTIHRIEVQKRIDSENAG